MERDYAERRAERLRDLDGVRAEIDPDKRIGHVILDRPPLNIVSTARAGRSAPCSRRWTRTTTSA